MNRRGDEPQSSADAGRQPEEDQTSLHDDGSPNDEDLAGNGSTEGEMTNEGTAKNERDHLGLPSDPADQSSVDNNADEDDVNSNTLVNDPIATGDLADPPPTIDSDVGDLSSGTLGTDGSASGDPADPPPAADSADGDPSSRPTGDGAAAEATRRKMWTWQEIYEQWRRFNIDLAPKVHGKVILNLKYNDMHDKDGTML